MVIVKSLGIDDTRALLEKGFTDFELQLCEDILEFGADHYFDLFSQLEGLNVMAIHTPIIKGECLELLGLDKNSQAFIDTCRVAEMFAQKLDHNVKVVIHTGTDLQGLECHIHDDAVKLISEVLAGNPHIEIMIENTMSLGISPKGEVLFRKGTDSHFHDCARYIRRILSTERVGSLIDVCHAQGSIALVELIKAVEPVTIVDTLEDYFKNGKDICKEVHLAQAKGLGMGWRKEHGLGYSGDNPNDVKLLKQILSYVKQYIPDALIVVEVSEEDYHNCPIQCETAITVEKLLRSMSNENSNIDSLGWQCSSN